MLERNSCVKFCPQKAIEVRHHVDVVPLGASVQPLRGSDSILWTIKFRNGNVKGFKFPIRTTPEGSADPYGGKPKADSREIERHDMFFTKSIHADDMSQFVASK